MTEAHNKGPFILARIMTFLGAFPFIFLALLFPLFGFKDMRIKEWIKFSVLVAIPLLLFFVSLFPKCASHILFWRASQEQKVIYIRRSVIVAATLLAGPVICFIYGILSGRILRGLAEI